MARISEHISNRKVRVIYVAKLGKRERRKEKRPSTYRVLMRGKGIALGESFLSFFLF